MICLRVNFHSSLCAVSHINGWVGYSQADSEFEGPLLPDFGEFERPLAASRLREMFYGAYAEYGIINLKAKYMLLNKSIDLYHHVFTVIVFFSIHLILIIFIQYPSGNQFCSLSLN